MEDPSPPRVRLLGELRLAACSGRAVALPPSRKTRALLGYLIATGQPHRRERLCDLFWDGPDDPRAELRWSLSKIRALLDGYEGMRLAADRERVSIELANAAVDLPTIRLLLGHDLSKASTAALKDASALFGGEFLDGLDLPLCYRYQEWCMAERETASRLRLAVLATLVRRLQDHPSDALSYARTLALADPLSETGHAAVVRLLCRLGRTRDALDHYERARRILETELGTPPSAELEEARCSLPSASSRSAPVAPPAGEPDGVSTPSRPSTLSSAIVGRDDECALLDRIVGAPHDSREMVLVTGEPGIGKSHMLALIGERVAALRGGAFVARAYEAEATRPYGVWIDVLRGMAREHPLPPDLGPLLPELDTAAVDPGNRHRLFDAVVDLLRQLASKQPTAVLLDDIQWMDEASASLLHYVMRHADAAPGLLVACAARTGEIDDNAGASGVVRSLRREGRLQEIALAALDYTETAALVGQVDPALDAARIFAESGGNPLFTLALARAHRRGDSGPGGTVEAVIASQLAPLAERTLEVLLWAAAHGRAFTPDDLARAARLGGGELLMALGELERRGLVRPASDDAYDFTHDLVRQTAYRTISQPRRKLLHRNIARALEEAGEPGGALAADLAHHAALAGDLETAARACAIAGDRALRLFANAEAAGFAHRGLRHVERLAEGGKKLELQLALLRIRVLAATGPGLRPLPPLADIIAEATSAAEGLGLQAAAATGHYLLSVVHQEAGDARRAESSTLRAAEAGRATDDATRAHQLANTARCLLELETEIGRSRKLVVEAGAVAAPLGLELCELHWARGLLERWDGQAEEAVASLARALALARRGEDRWREYKCLTWLAMLEQELGRHAAMQARCAELKDVAARLGEDEAPFVETLQALAALATRDASADAAMAGALARLRAVDDKSYLAYALNAAAWLHRQAGRTAQARLYAREALGVASIMRRRNEIAIAGAMLAAIGDDATIPDIDSFAAASSGPDDLSARARRSGAVPASSGAIPTAIPTLGRQV